MNLKVVLGLTLFMALNHTFADGTTESEAKWASIEIQMTAPSAKEFVGLIADDADNFEDWGRSVKNGTILNRNDIKDANCTAKVTRPIGNNDLPLTETLTNRIDCTVTDRSGKKVDLTFSLAHMPLARWGTHWLQKAFTVNGKYADLLFKSLQKATDAIDKHADERMLTDDFTCDAFQYFCLDGYTVHQTPVIGSPLDNTTVSAISCNRETDISEATKSEIKIHYEKYISDSNLGGEAAEKAKAEFNRYLADVHGKKDDKTMLTDQLRRGVRTVSRLTCTWMETD
ncbi:MAG: hypothetical protein JWQ35_2407 [Bacteriovoracaceae bacterium]|nr:hypothetical protein [Bacteriovoracaceae bacterium]